jgi:hypothetical protein
VTCAEFADVVGELVRERLDGASRARALAHSRGCSACAARIAEAETLRSLLARLAAADRHRGAPPQVERHLAQHLREGIRTGRPPRRPEVNRWLLFAAGLAATLAMVSVASSPAPRGSAPPTQGDAEFLPLVYGDTLADLDSVQIVRVRLPRTALASIGWPGTGNPDARSVDADLILGHDGVARAIRFVP